MKRLLSLAVVAFLMQGCHSQSVRTNEEIAPVEFGNTCRLSSCIDCTVTSCPLSNQDMVGASCSCPTAHGIQYGTVTP